MLRKATKLFGLLLCAALLMVLSAQLDVPVSAATVANGTCGENIAWVLDDQGVLTLTGKGAMNTAYDAVPWEQYKETIKTVIIFEGVTSIGDHAFSGCSSLTNITIPNSVTGIGSDAFSYCSSLTNIAIPNGVKSIGNYAFSYCSSLTNITLPESVKSIGNYAFWDCASLTGVTIPEGVTSIGNSMFADCTSLTSIALPQGVKSIGNYAFSGCDRLTDITIPDSVAVIGSYAFSYCSNLTNITIPEGVTGIGYSVFSYCSNLTNITLPESVKSIGGYAFRSCSSLTGINIPAGICSIDEGAFGYCTSLKSIRFMGAAPTTIASNCFTGVSADVYTLCTDPSWTEAVKQQYGGKLTWVGHLFADGIYNQDATCTQNGTKIVPCLGCGTESTVEAPNTAIGHSFDSAGICARCGAITEIIINMTDSYGDGWGGCAIEVYANGSLLTAATVSSGASDQLVLAYPIGSTYVFRWKAGSYSDECSFEITLSGQVLICGKGNGYTDGQAIYTLETCVHQYEAVVTAPTCTQDGFTTYTCSNCGKEYTDNVVAPLGHNYTAEVTEPTCTQEGSTRLTCQRCPMTHSAVIPAIGHSFAEGICSICGETDPDCVKPIVQPTLKLKAPALEFKDMIKVVAFYTAENMQDVVEMGTITYSSKVDTWSVETAEYVIPGASYDTASDRYYSASQGIHAKYLGDTVYLAIYAKLSDGSYVYTTLASYSPVTYATNQLKGNDIELKQLCAAMLNYGAAAQNYFGHNTDAPANSSMTAEQLALPEAYRADMVQAVPGVPKEKQGAFAANKGFSKRSPAVSFESAFSIHYFFTPAYMPVGQITFYYWNEADLNAAEVLTPGNASGSFAMSGEGQGQYHGEIVGIAAKDLSNAVYVAAVYSDGTNTWTSGVLGYSIGAYCSSQAGKGGTMAELAMATAVYGYHAKQYFG